MPTTTLMFLSNALSAPRSIRNPRTIPYVQYQVMQKSAWIWFVGCAVWFLDGVEQLHVHAQAHAELAFILAMLFLVAGFFYRNQKK